ncbi:TetR/AcrR family transcriptional regulator [Aquipuribacter sp. SD81]|uniref:TetR/AcrR family transcriptional regulator n=1 Tax=Aquipuribacter sp. SD81 TaxID=3127703 RepID=UPI0030172C9B
MNTVNASDVRSPVVPRRERVRAATEAEIVATARNLLVAGGPSTLTLREVGRRMGMTASALYRYVDGHDGLVDRLAASFFDELTEALRATLDGGGTTGGTTDDVVDGTTEGSEEAADRAVSRSLMAASRAFRRWSLEHPAEFALMYGGTVHQLESGCPRTEAAGNRFGAVFLRLLLDRLPGVPVPAGTDGSPTGAAGPAPVGDGAPVFAVLPGPLGEMFARAWVRLLGLVMVEVVGKVGHTGADPERLFEAEMADCCRSLLAVLRDVRTGTGGRPVPGGTGAETVPRGARRP